MCVNRSDTPSWRLLICSLFNMPLFTACFITDAGLSHLPEHHHRQAVRQRRNGRRWGVGEVHSRTTQWSSHSSYDMLPASAHCCSCQRIFQNACATSLPCLMWLEHEFDLIHLLGQVVVVMTSDGAVELVAMPAQINLSVWVFVSVRLPKQWPNQWGWLLWRVEEISIIRGAQWGCWPQECLLLSKMRVLSERDCPIASSSLSRNTFFV